MKRRLGSKHYFSVIVALMTAISLGCLSMADENESIDVTDEQEITVVDCVDPEEACTDEDESVIIADGSEEVTIDDEADIIADGSEGVTIDDEADIVADGSEAVTTDDMSQDVEPDSEIADDEDSESYVVDESIVSEEASYAPANGWDQVNDRWYYYKNGTMIKGWKYIDGNWYRFDKSTGVMLTGLIYDDETEAYYILGLKGQMLKGWQQYGDYWFYLDNDGKAVRGWNKIGGKWYYFYHNENSAPYMYSRGIGQVEGGDYYFFGINGEMLTGWQQYDERWYYADRATGIVAKGLTQIGGKWYYFNRYMYKNYETSITDENGNVYRYRFGEDGAAITGWYNTNVYYDKQLEETVYSGKWYYYDKATARAATGWKKIGGYWYFFNKDYSPYMVTGIQYLPDADGAFSWYAFDYEGKMITGWYNTYVYVDEKGKTVYDGSWYYFDKNTGKAAVGWRNFNGKWYFFDDDGSEPYMYKDGLFRISDSIGDEYYYAFDSNGVMLTGWYNSDTYKDPKTGKIYYFGGWFYLGADGKAYTGWHKINGKYYYFTETYSYRPEMRRGGVTLIDNEYYYLDPDTGACFTGGWLEIVVSGESEWFYFNSNGKAAREWKQIGGQWYFFGEKTDFPYMRTRFADYEGKKYYLGNSGVMRKGWINDNGYYYYADSHGVVLSGWQKIGGNIFYFESSYGRMAKGLREINGVLYDFGQNGICRNPPKNI